MGETLSSMPISWLDLSVLAILVLSGLLAYVRGFVREVLSIGAWVGAAVVTYIAYPHALPYAQQWTEIEIVSSFGTMTAVFIVVLLVLTIVSGFIARGVKDSAIGPLDRALGFLFGLVRGAFLVCLAFILLVFFLNEDNLPDPVYRTRSLPFVALGSDMMLTLVPAETSQRLRDAIQRVRQGVSMAVEQEETFRMLTRPTPQENTKDETAEPSYQDSERRGMEALIDQNK